MSTGVSLEAAGVVALFPGIGAQRTGVGKPLYDRYPVYRETVEEASDLLGTDVAALCFEPEQRGRLARQEEAQLCVFTTSVAMYRVFVAEVGIAVACCAGHSLGEYSALCCAGALDFGAALELVRRRGELVRDVARSLHGTMMWVLDLDVDVVEGVCRHAREDGLAVHVAAHDAPRQAAVSGRESDVRRLAAEFEARGGVVFPLRLEGPYHSPMMRPAAERMAALLADYEIRPPEFPVLSTVDAEPHPGGAASAARLAEQLMSPVRWLDIQRRLVDDGAGIAVEMGPGTVLGFLLAKTTSLIRTLAMDRRQDVDTLRDEMVLAEADYAGLLEGCLRVAVSTRSRRQVPPAAYRDRAVLPYRRLEELDRRARDGDALGVAEAGDALRQIGMILDAKGITGNERRRQVNRALGGRLPDDRVLAAAAAEPAADPPGPGESR